MEAVMIKANKHCCWVSSGLILLLSSPNVFGCGDDDASVLQAGQGGTGESHTGGDSGAAPNENKLADGVVGNACAADTDCGSGSCLTTIPVVNTSYPNGYCTGRCSTDEACGASGVCVPGLFGSAGSCFRRCDEANGCEREGYRCRVVSNVGRCVAAPPPLPDHVAGNACTDDVDCGGGAMSCTAMLGSVPAPGGYCSQACAISDDCGAGGTCVNGISIVTISSGRCVKSCSAPTDCRSGYECKSFSGVDSGGPGACTPLGESDDAGVP
jgi:hypothetical protein